MNNEAVELGDSYDSNLDFPIIITRYEVSADAPPNYTPGNAYWVRLPHQCDEWSIADTSTVEGAIVEIDKFIAALELAKERLRGDLPPA